MSRRVEVLYPRRTVCSGKTLELLEPATVVMQEAAAIDGNRGTDAVVDAGDHACHVATPGDARDADAVGVHPWQGRKERKSTRHGRDGVVRPHLLEPLAHRAELLLVPLLGASVWQPLSACPAAAEVHRDGCVSPLVPHLHPLRERRAAAAVDEDHARHVAGPMVRDAAVGEDARRLPPVGLSLVENGGVVDPLRLWRSAPVRQARPEERVGEQADLPIRARRTPPQTAMPARAASSKCRSRQPT